MLGCESHTEFRLDCVFCRAWWIVKAHYKYKCKFEMIAAKIFDMPMNIKRTMTTKQKQKAEATLYVMLGIVIGMVWAYIIQYIDRALQ